MDRSRRIAWALLLAGMLSPSARAGVPDPRPSLHALVVGVSSLGGPATAAADAAALAEALGAQQGRFYKAVAVRTLIDGRATGAAVTEGLAWLRTVSTGRDVALVFLAAPGAPDGEGGPRFALPDARPGPNGSRGLPGADLAAALAALPGRRLLLLQACDTGALADGAQEPATGRRCAVDMSAAVNDIAGHAGGTVVLAASTGREVASARPGSPNGAFIQALIEGLRGGADLLGRGLITTETLAIFVEDRVKTLTEGGQHPLMVRPPTVPDFPIAGTP